MTKTHALKGSPMRTDENGDPCPSTLGEYRDLCAAIGGEDCEAVTILDSRISQDSDGRNAVVIVPDSQMRFLLLLPLLQPRGRLLAVGP